MQMVRRNGGAWIAALRTFLGTAIIALVAAALPALAQNGAAGGTLRILAFGDSLTAGYGVAQDEAFPAQLEAALRDRGHDVRILNGGVSGDTTAGGRARVDWSLGDNPDAMILELGANDGLRGLDPQQTYENLNAIINRSKAAGVPILLTGMYAPPNLGTEYGEDFNGVFPRLAEEHDLLFYPFFLEGVAREPELNLPDGLHPNREGVARVVENILPKVEELIAVAREDQASQ